VAGEIGAMLPWPLPWVNGGESAERSRGTKLGLGRSLVTGDSIGLAGWRDDQTTISSQLLENVESEVIDMYRKF
jgi:hypothetical protein